MWTRDWKGASTNFLEAVGMKWNCACPKTEPKREASNNLQLPKHAKTMPKPSKKTSSLVNRAAF